MARRTPTARRRRTGARALGAALLAAGLAGCGGGIVIGSFDCDNEIATMTDRFGRADRFDSRIDDGFHVDTFFFDGRGLVITFTWSASVPCERHDRVVVR